MLLPWKSPLKALITRLLVHKAQHWLLLLGLSTGSQWLLLRGLSLWPQCVPTSISSILWLSALALGTVLSAIGLSAKVKDKDNINRWGHLMAVVTFVAWPQHVASVHGSQYWLSAPCSQHNENGRWQWSWHSAYHMVLKTRSSKKNDREI